MSRSKEKCSFCDRVIGNFPAVAAPNAIICEDCVALAVEILKAHDNGELVNGKLMTVIDLGIDNKDREAGIYKCYFDGSSKGNPGEANCGYVVFNENKEIIKREGKLPLGIETNNYAEYMGLIHLLGFLVSVRAKEVEIYGDSQLVVNQVNEAWRANNPRMKKLCSDAKKLMAKIPKCRVSWIPREKNTIADALAQKK